MKKRVVIGLLGPTLDRLGKGDGRWNNWRPSVAVVQQADLAVDRFDLIFQSKFSDLGQRITADITTASPSTKVVGHDLKVSDAWDFEEVFSALLDFARGYAFDTEHEEYLLHITTGTHVAQICMFLLAESRYFPARLLQTAPTPKIPNNPKGEYRIIDLDLSRYDKIASRFQANKEEALTFLKSGIATRSAAFNKLIEEIELVAINSSEPLLLLGPTGAGKSRLARRIYELKKSKHTVSGQFVELNCATLRGDSSMSTLFGHTKGAFTGAAAARSGLLKAADGGMLFLDEIGELGLDEQALLLQALEEKRFLPVGSDKEVHSNFQLIAGTNRDLSQAVSQGRFREDLLARINLWSFLLPALRERTEDIEPNLAYELEKFAQRNNSKVTMSTEAKKRYLAFATSSHAAWLGNFRDLNSSVIRMATFAQGGRITESIVELEIQRLVKQWEKTNKSDSADNERLLLRFGKDEQWLHSLDRFDQAQVVDVLRVCADSASLAEAGRLLFATSRTLKKSANDADRLRKYLKRFDLSF